MDWLKLTECIPSIGYKPTKLIARETDGDEPNSQSKPERVSKKDHTAFDYGYSMR